MATVKGGSKAAVKIAELGKKLSDAQSVKIGFLEGRNVRQRYAGRGRGRDPRVRCPASAHSSSSFFSQHDRI